MKTLLWKEYRQNRTLLIAVGILVLLPYFLGLPIALIDYVTGHVRKYPLPRLFTDYLFFASGLSLAFSVLMMAFIGANAIAGEQADRSAEFVAYLPVPRRSAIVGKAVLAIGTCLLIWLVNVSILFVAGYTSDCLIDLTYHKAFEGITLSLVTGILIFGVSWLFSSLLSSPAIAAASGLASSMFVCGLLISLGSIIEYPLALYLLYLLALPPILGIACFVLGVVLYLRRIEP